MSDPLQLLRVFVDAHPVDVALGATALDAVRTFNPALSEEVEGGARMITDSRGLPIATETPMVAGFILRVIARRLREDPNVDDDLR